MNTDTRRNIFCILMTAEDYMDAFEKLHHLGLKDQQAREIIYVIMDCCLQEKKFNPYYAVLAQKFCDYDRKNQASKINSIYFKKSFEFLSQSLQLFVPLSDDVAILHLGQIKRTWRLEWNTVDEFRQILDSLVCRKRTCLVCFKSEFDFSLILKFSLKNRLRSIIFWSIDSREAKTKSCNYNK